MTSRCSQETGEHSKRLSNLGGTDCMRVVEEGHGKCAAPFGNTYGPQATHVLVVQSPAFGASQIRELHQIFVDKAADVSLSPISSF